MVHCQIQELQGKKWDNNHKRSKDKDLEAGGHRHFQGIILAFKDTMNIPPPQT